MIAITIAAVVGFILGAVTTGAAFLVRIRHVACPEPEAHELSPADRETVSAEFATHAASVRRELNRYADALADGDGPLREQLRKFEAGV